MAYTNWKRVCICERCFRPVKESFSAFQGDLCQSCGSVNQSLSNCSICFKNSPWNRILCFFGDWQNASYKVRVKDEIYVFERGKRLVTFSESVKNEKQRDLDQEVKDAQSNLLAELTELYKMIDRLPPDSVIDRMSLEARKDKVEKVMADLEHHWNREEKRWQTS